MGTIILIGAALAVLLVILAFLALCSGLAKLYSWCVDQQNEQLAKEAQLEADIEAFARRIDTLLQSVEKRSLK